MPSRANRLLPSERRWPVGILDKITDAVGDNSDQVSSAIDAAGDVVDDKTDNKFAEQVDQAQDFLKDQVAKVGDDQ